MLDLAVHLLLPCLILDHVIVSAALRDYGNLLISPLLGLVVMAGSILIARLAAALWHFPADAQARTFAFVTGMFNYGYLPVPLVDALYGANALAILFPVPISARRSRSGPWAFRCSCGTRRCATGGAC